MSGVAALICSCGQRATPASTVPAAAGAYADLNGIRMYYEVHGQGEPLLLLHGATTSADTWRNQIPVLAKHFRVIAPDLRGHGRTTDSDRPLGYPLMASDVIELLEHLGIERAHVVGWSAGGAIGLELAVRHPERVRDLVLIGSLYHRDGLDEGFAETVRTIAAEAWAPAAVEFYRAHAPDPSHWPAFFEKFRTLALTEPTFSLEDLGRVRARTLILVGEEEPYIRRDHTEEMHRAIPESRFVSIPGGTHHVHNEKPEEVNRALLFFLRRRD